MGGHTFTCHAPKNVFSSRELIRGMLAANCTTLCTISRFYWVNTVPPSGARALSVFEHQLTIGILFLLLIKAFSWDGSHENTAESLKAKSDALPSSTVCEFNEYYPLKATPLTCIACMVERNKTAMIILRLLLIMILM